MNNGFLFGPRFLTLRLHMNQLKAADIEGNKKSSRRQIAVISKRRLRLAANIKGGNLHNSKFIIC